MKNINIVRHMFLLLICFGVLSCSNEQYEEDAIDDETHDSYISATLGTLNLPANLQCDMYIFWKSSGDPDYTFKEKVTLAGTQSKMRFPNKDLINKDYRFLFVATSSAEPEVNVTNKGNNTLDTNNKWTDVLISAKELLISADNYSGTLDKTGDEILNGGSIDGILTRMVGQIVLDIFRINGNISTPMDIVSADVRSVLDRVYKVEAEYSNITKSVVFNSLNNITDNEVWIGKHTATHNFIVDSELKVSVPQTNGGLEISPIGKTGSGRIKGIYCLPSDKKMRIKFIFHYYDTTPACGNSHAGSHTETCFDKRTLELNLPQDSQGATLISVKPNYFTVNKAGIKYDRIIDLNMNSSISFETEWSK